MRAKILVELEIEIHPHEELAFFVDAAAELLLEGGDIADDVGRWRRLNRASGTIHHDLPQGRVAELNVRRVGAFGDGEAEAPHD